MSLLIEIVGWCAAALILSAYLLLSSGRLTPDSRAYQAMNVAGALGFIVNSGWNGAIPSASVNVAWAAIGLWGLWRIGRGRSAAP